MNIRVDLVPAGRRNRPGKPCSCAYITLHETDNTSAGANAAAHAGYIKGEAAGSTSWHYTVDDREAVQHIPDNEAANHTGDALGNQCSLGVEICVNSDGDYEAAVRNAVALTRLLMRRHSIPVSRVRQHADWIKKDCPKRLRKGGWKSFLSALEDEEMARYQAIGEIPEWALPTAQKLLSLGVLRGKEAGLDLSEDMLRLLVINDRAGLYDQAESCRVPVGS